MWTCKMKVVAIVLLCAFAAVQGRSAVVSQNSKAPAALGQHRYIAHLRIVSTTGRMNTCTGSLIDPHWVLTAGSCLTNSRFIWASFGMVYVPYPGLVLETTTGQTNPSFGLGLVNFNETIHNTANIAPVLLGGDRLPQRLPLCLFRANGNAPGEHLNCYDVTVRVDNQDDIVATSNEVSFSAHDNGAALVAYDYQIGVLRNGFGNSGNFIVLGYEALDWISATTGINIPR